MEFTITSALEETNYNGNKKYYAIPAGMTKFEISYGLYKKLRYSFQVNQVNRKFVQIEADMEANDSGGLSLVSWIFKNDI